MMMFSFLTLDAWDNFLAWLDGVDWGTVVFYMAFVMLAATILTLSISLVVSHSRDQAFGKEMSYQSSTVRYFNLSDMSNVKNVSLNQFYSSFPLSEQSKVREWITSVLNGEPHSTYLATDVIFHRERHMAPSFLKIVSAKPELGLVHLESYLLRYPKPTRRCT